MSKSDRMKQYWQDVKDGKRAAPRRGDGKGVVRRKVRCESNWLRGSEVILTIYPHGELGFREPRCRAEYRLSMKEAFRQAVVITTNKIAAKFKELRKTHTPAEARRMARKAVL